MFPHGSEINHLFFLLLLLLSHFSHVPLLVTQWTAAYQAPPPMGFFRQVYWIGLPLPSPINKAQNLWENKRYPKREITEKKWEAKGKGEKERFAHLKAEFQRIARGLIPGSGRSPGEENGNPLQYSCLENYIDWGAWLATVHEVTELNTTKHLAHNDKIIPSQWCPWPHPRQLCMFVTLYGKSDFAGVIISTIFRN